MNANQIFQRGGGMARGSLRAGERLGRRVVSETWGIFKDARHLGRKPKPEMDDVTLARKVETEIFRGRGPSKATVSVNVVDGVVWLRGEVKRPEQVRRLEEKARSVPEVRGVENLLHLVKTPAPTRADTPKRQQRTRSSTRRAAPKRRAAGRVSDDRTDALTPQAEPSPAEHASTGEGRSPTALGASGTSDQPAPPAPPMALSSAHLSTVPSRTRRKRRRPGHHERYSTSGHPAVRRSQPGARAPLGRLRAPAGLLLGAIRRICPVASPLGENAA